MVFTSQRLSTAIKAKNVKNSKELLDLRNLFFRVYTTSDSPGMLIFASFVLA
jgi:hypothetical protein